MKAKILTFVSSAALSVFCAGAFANPFAALFTPVGMDTDPTAVVKDADRYAQRQPEWARPYMRALYRDGEWGAVLNLNRLGLAAMERQKFSLARKAFDQAIVRVEAIYADDANAAKARSVFNAERVKDFKGEPYERAMMYYYRGLLYLEEGDFQNARAAFLAADRHDTLSSAEDKAFAGDFGLMKYLAGWASACDGDAVRAAQLIAEAQAADTLARALPRLPGHGLILVDMGSAPVKWGDGKYREILRIRPGGTPGSAPDLQHADGMRPQALTIGADIDVQATTRGGREVDGILAGKAQFKDGAGAVGDTAMVVGSSLASNAAMLGNSNLANIGMAGMLIGLMAKGVEMASTPEADLRAWDTLPSRVLVSVSPQANAEPLRLLGAQSKAFPIQTVHGACSIAWARATPSVAPPSAEADAAPAEAHRGDRNRAFRAMLDAEMAASE